jgi:hypothetical protein
MIWCLSGRVFWWPTSEGDVSLISAWRAWWEGSPMPDLTVWGLRLLWWGRLGKMGEFLGGLTVLLDIIGSERLRAWGRNLRDRQQPARARAGKLWRNAHRLPFAFVRYMWVERMAWEELKQTPLKAREPLREERDQRRQQFDEQYPVGCLPLLIGSGMLWVPIVWPEAASVLPRPVSSMPGWLAAVFMLLLFTFVLQGLLVALLALVFASTGVLVDLLVARPIAVALGTAHPGVSVKWIGVVLIVVGFHFDLLAT